LQEILLTEVLSRVWAATCTVLDRRRGRDEAGPIAGSVLAGHFESRNRVLSLLVNGYGLGTEDAVRLNRCRLHAERWTDMLLSFLSRPEEVDAFAFDTARVQEWSNQSGTGLVVQRRSPNGSLAAAALACVAREGQTEPTANEDLNQQIGASLLACLPSGLFDSLGPFPSALQRCLSRVAPDTSGPLPIPAQSAAAPPTVVRDTGGWFHRRERRVD